MRVAHLIDNLRLVGGAQRVLVLLTHSAHNTDLELTVIDLKSDSDSPNLERLKKAGVDVLHFPAENMRDAKRFLSLVRYLKHEQFDLIHTHLLHSNVIGILASKLAGTPVIGSLYNVHISRRKNHTFRYGLETLLLRYAADGVMAVGQLTAEAHQSRLKGKRIYVIPTAVEIPELLSPQEKQLMRESLVGDARRPLIVSVGRLTTQKGYTYLLDAFSQVHKRWPQAALVIAGEGALFDELSLKIRGLNLNKHAFLLGPRSDVQRLLGACDIFVSSSLWEGLPSALLEGMAAGLPVVATTVGDMPRVVTPDTGLLIPAEDPDAIAGAIIELLDHPQQRKLMGEAAREYAITHHGLDAYGKHFLHMYKDVLYREKPPGRRQTGAVKASKSQFIDR